jgi:hypothetical protein
MGTAMTAATVDLCLGATAPLLRLALTLLAAAAVAAAVPVED